ncbi:MAG: hypothetical protein ACLR43_08540 [Faecalibacillus faecis]
MVKLLMKVEGMFMTTMDICYCVLILAGAFCLVALGVLFIRTSTAIKQTGILLKWHKIH